MVLDGGAGESAQSPVASDGAWVNTRAGIWGAVEDRDGFRDVDAVAVQPLEDITSMSRSWCISIGAGGTRDRPAADAVFDGGDAACAGRGDFPAESPFREVTESERKRTPLPESEPLRCKKQDDLASPFWFIMAAC